MDEPFFSLDLKLKKEISELFIKIQRDSGRGALFVTHSADEALDIADRILVINGGAIVLDVSAVGADKAELRKRLIDELIA